MGLFRMKCPSQWCQKVDAVFADKFEDVPQNKLVCDCGERMVRVGRGPTSTTKEVLDNGLMPQAIERFVEIDRLVKERVRDADPLAGGANFDPYAK